MAAVILVASLAPLLSAQLTSFGVGAHALVLIVVGGVCIVGSSLLFLRTYSRFADRLMVQQAALEGIEIWSIASLAMWAWLYDALDTTRLSLGLSLAAIVTIAGMCACMFMAASREPDDSLRRMTYSASALLVGDLMILHAQINGNDPWPGELVTCLAWCLLLWLLPSAQTRTQATDGEAERRRLIVMGTLVALLLTATFAALLIKLRVPPELWPLALIFVASMWGRERVQAKRSWNIMARLTEQAIIDPLTELPNRRGLNLWLQSRCPKAGKALAVLTVDIDQFKDVNDLLGNNRGDELLCRVARELSCAVEPLGAQVYRMGGDEFTVMVEATPAQAQELAGRIIGAVDEAAQHVPGVSRLGVGASVGVQHVQPQNDGEAVAAAIVQSGLAMRAAKSAGKGRTQTFDDDLENGYRRRKRVEMRLRDQIHNVEVYYQPFVDTRTWRVTGYEALARWVDPELGPVSPTEFIEVAESSGLIHELGAHILDTALADLSHDELLGSDRHVNVNVSALQLKMPGYVEDVFAALAAHDLPPSRLVLELTESISVSTEGTVARTMASLANAGVRFAIDDFGAGSTSVAYMARLPVSWLKIDRSLTNDLSDPRVAGIVRGVLEMCRGLKLGVVLEGVETTAQERLACEFGVQVLQGWLYSKALPAAELAQASRLIESRVRSIPLPPQRSSA